MARRNRGPVPSPNFRHIVNQGVFAQPPTSKPGNNVQTLLETPSTGYQPFFGREQPNDDNSWLFLAGLEGGSESFQAEFLTSAVNQPVSFGEEQYPAEIYQDAFASPFLSRPLHGETFQDQLEFQHVPLLGFPPFIDESVLTQDPPLNTNNLFAWAPVAEPQENAANTKHSQDQPILEPVGRVDPQPLHPSTIPINAAHGIGNQAGQKSYCGGKCRGNFVGSHKCSYQRRVLTISCQTCPQKFARKNDFNRHCNDAHGGKKTFDCPTARCNRIGKEGFKRKDNLTQHRRLVHGENIKKNPIRFKHGNNAGDLALEEVGSAGD